MKFQTVKLGVAVEAPDVQAEDLEFKHIEQTEEDRDESYAQTLGLEGRLDRYMGGPYEAEADDEEEGENELFERTEDKS